MSWWLDSLFSWIIISIGIFIVGTQIKAKYVNEWRGWVYSTVFFWFGIFIICWGGFVVVRYLFI